MKITSEYYGAHIPKCCRLRTYKEHAEQLLLCWGLIHDLENGIEQKECGMDCEEHVNHDPALLIKILKETNEPK